MPGSTVFDRARATGLRVADWQNVILVNMLGQRFYDETGRQFTANNYKSGRPLHAGQLSEREERRATTRPTSSTRRWPGSATGTTAAARSGRSSTPTRWRARGGTRRRRTSISTRGFFFSADTLARTGAQDRHEISARADAAGSARGDRGAIQYLRRRRRRRRISASPRPATRSRNRPSMPPGRRRWCTTRAPVCGSTPSARSMDMDGAGHPGALLRGRIGGRLQPARPGPCCCPGSDRGEERGAGKWVLSVRPERLRVI